MAISQEAPLISVIMGVYYNRDSLELLQRSVRSILQQTVRDFEFLICDDGSSEEAKAYLSGIAQQEPRVKLLRPGNKTTLPEKLNYCLNEAKGEFIARMDDDDYSYPDRFEKQLAVLQSNPNLAFVGCNVNYWRDDAICGKRILPEYPAVKDFYMTLPYLHPTLIFRASALRAVGGYSEDPHQILCEDYDLLMRMYAKDMRGRNLQEVLLDYTVAASAKAKSRMKYRWNETVTRYGRFRDMGLLPQTLPYVVKPLVVGLMPEKLLGRLKKRAGH